MTIKDGAVRQLGDKKEQYTFIESLTLMDKMWTGNESLVERFKCIKINSLFCFRHSLFFKKKKKSGLYNYHLCYCNSSHERKIITVIVEIIGNFFCKTLLWLE